MQTIRAALYVMIVGLLCVGYAASQWEWLTANFASYAKKVDVPPVQHLALVVLLVTVGAACYWSKPKEVGDGSS